MGRHEFHQAQSHRCPCGETRPEMFYGDRKSLCKKCQSAENLARYHARRATEGVRLKVTRPRKPNDWTPEEIEAAAKLGLTVPQYREALSERSS